MKNEHFFKVFQTFRVLVCVFFQGSLVPQISLFHIFRLNHFQLKPTSPRGNFFSHFHFDFKFCVDIKKKRLFSRLWKSFQMNACTMATSWHCLNSICVQVTLGNFIILQVLEHSLELLGATQSTQKLNEVNWNSTKQLIFSKNQVYLGLFLECSFRTL